MDKILLILSHQKIAGHGFKKAGIRPLKNVVETGIGIERTKKLPDMALVGISRVNGDDRVPDAFSRARFRLHPLPKQKVEIHHRSQRQICIKRFFKS